MTSTPASSCWATISSTAVLVRSSSASGSTGTPSCLANIVRIRSAGRGRLPTWVVRVRSDVLGFTCSSLLFGLAPLRGGLEIRMQQPLKGPHHFTGITRDVTTNVDFWCKVMGLRFVKNTLNFETTFRYHTYFGDEEGNPGSVVTFLEFNEAKPGVAGDGDIQRMVLRVRSYDSLEYWMDRLIANDMDPQMVRLDPTQPQSLVFHDPEHHEVELMVSDATDTPLVAGADDIPAEHRILGLEGARSFTTLEEQLPFAEHLGFRRDGTRLVLDGERSGRWDFSAPPGRAPGARRVRG